MSCVSVVRARPSVCECVCKKSLQRINGPLEAPPLGFLNPWLYANADAFTDVTVGTNAIGHQPGRPGPVGATPYGFNCTAGWDPVTGLGTPRFGELLTRL